jgi:hypothetical protein
MRAAPHHVGLGLDGGEVAPDEERAGDIHVGQVGHGLGVEAQPLDGQPREAAGLEMQVELGARLHFFRRGVERFEDVEGRHVPILPHRHKSVLISTKREPGGQDRRAPVTGSWGGSGPPFLRQCGVPHTGRTRDESLSLSGTV